VLISDLQKAVSSRRYATGGSYGDAATNKTKKGVLSHGVTITDGGRHPRSRNSVGNESELSVLSNKAQGEGHIVRTDDYDVESTRGKYGYERYSRDDDIEGKRSRVRAAV